MSILLVEDEPNIVSVIKRGLAAEGYNISVAVDGLTGLQMATDHVFDLVILDVMLPGMNGIQLCQRIRERDNTIPILMLTALDSTENIVTGLNSGADDYMVKPFNLAELAARIKTLLRRAANSAPLPKNIYRIDDIIIDTDARVASQNNVPLNLTATEYRLLEYFVKNQRKVLSRIQLLENVWDINFNLGTNVVDVYINYLRKKLDKKNPTRYIHTVFGMGYMMKEADK